MTISGPFYYQVQANEPSIHVEIYLPKKAKLQGILYDALTAGFNISDVKRYFHNLNKPESVSRKEKVRRLARPGWTVLRDDLSDEEIEQFPRLFFGFSMYQVEGVFLKQIQMTEEDYDEDYIPIEELTQVIRIIFKYQCATSSMEVIDFAKAILRDPFSEIGTFEENYPEFAKRMSPETQEALKPIYTWIRYVGWFLYGFLLYQICERIVDLHERERNRWGNTIAESIGSTVKQDEIWVTSLWNMNVNVVKWSSSIPS